MAHSPDASNSSLFLGALLGGLAVGLGAFGAHAMKGTYAEVAL